MISSLEIVLPTIKSIVTSTQLLMQTIKDVLTLVIRNHPKMVAMWAKRVNEVLAKYGRTTAEKWATQLFEPDTLALINTELKRRAGSNG